MKKLCKNVELNTDFIEKAIYLCLAHKWTRSDVVHYLYKYSKRTYKEVKNLATIQYVEGKGNINRRSELTPEIRSIAKKMELEIKNREIFIPDIRYKNRYDTSSQKMREIGIESIKQQFYDYVAVEAMKELFDRKIGDNQFACLPGRGQEFGKKRIEGWVRNYPNQCKYVGKADIRKCYPSIPIDRLLDYLKKWVKNDDIIYLVETLVGSYKNGLSIGSYLSTWLCNLYLSQLYHYASENLYKTRKKKDGSVERKRLIFKIAFYMDDIVVFGSRKADVLMAVKRINKFLNKELQLTLKEDWRVFKLEGNIVDIMGYKIANDKTTIRSKTFVKIRRTYKKADRMIRETGSLTLPLARRCISYNGKIKHSDSRNFRKKYNTDNVFKIAKRRVSYESKIHRQTAEC